MPAHDRQQQSAPSPSPRLPRPEDASVPAAAAAPLSSLFGTSFDLAAVESAAQLADNSIFITSSGSRFRLQRISEPPEDRKPPQPAAAGLSGPRDGPATPSTAAQLPQSQQRWQPPNPPQRQPPSPPPSIRDNTRPPTATAAFPGPSPYRSRGSFTASSRSSTASGPTPSGYGSSGPLCASRGGSEPSHADVDDAAQRMSYLSVGHGFGGFGASALYSHSDGGVQAAETLTESDPARRLGSGSIEHSRGSGDYGLNMSGGSAHEEYRCDPYPHTQGQPLESAQYRQPQLQSSYGSYQGPQSLSQDLVPSQFASPYDSPHGSPSQGDSPHHGVGSMAATSSLPNSDHFSPPAYGSSHDVGGVAALSHHGFSVGGFSSYPPEKPGMVSRSQSLPSLMEESHPVFFTPPPPQPAASPTSLQMSPPAFSGGIATPAPSLTPSPGDVNGIDTLTPVVVMVHSPPSAIPPVPSAVTPDSSSATRDNVLPGEDVLYDGFVKSAHSVSGPFEEGHLKVFRNNLTQDLRFHCKSGNNTDTHWMKGTKAQMVPVYAYDQRSQNLVFIRDNDGEKRHGSIPAQPVINGPSAIYQFAYLQDLFKFQSKLTGESVVLDISSVKWIRLARANSRSVEMYSSVRLQIWHEPRSRKTTSSDQASFITAGTSVSGPLRERTVPNSSRLMVFLGRSEEYITAFVTDDIEMEPKGHMSVRLKPRKYSGVVHKRNSKPGIRARLELKSGTEPAGLAIHGEPFNPDVEGNFELYKTFEIEFESSPSQINFVQAWTEVIEERRKQRARLAKIQEDMRKETFSSKEAMSIRT